MNTYELMFEQLLHHMPDRSTEQEQDIDGPGDKLFHVPPENIPVASGSDTLKGPLPQHPEKVGSSSIQGLN
eukprot:219698-Ditylum_brightwellii.AAC.1